LEGELTEVKGKIERETNKVTTAQKTQAEREKSIKTLTTAIEATGQHIK